MNLWLDDIREPPGAGWIWAKTVPDAIKFFEENPIEVASLDHDLGKDDEGNELDEGYKLCLWMAEHQRWPADEIRVHSANPPGVERMCGVIERYGPYERVGGRSIFRRASS